MNQVILGVLLASTAYVCMSLVAVWFNEFVITEKYKKTKLYISGGITNVPDYKEQFEQARNALEKKGYLVEDPTTYGFDENTSLHKAMRHDLIKMLECDGVVLLDNWTLSHGSCYEAVVACDMNIPVKSLQGWLNTEV